MATPKSFEVVGKLPDKISVVFLDIDKTITGGDVLDLDIAKLLVDLAKRRIRIVFVTGRDRFWLVKNLAEELKNIAGANYKVIAQFLQFDAELGLVSIDPLSFMPEILSEAKKNPLVIASVRERLASLCWQSQNLTPYQASDQVPPHYQIIKDANNNAFLIPHNRHKIDAAIKLPEFIWSDSKEIIATLEAIRDAVKREVPPEIEAMIPSATQILQAFIDHWHMGDSIRISPVGTAINITLILDGLVFDKDWAAGKTLRRIHQETGIDVIKIAERSIAVGDGRADFLFGRPYFGNNQYGDIAFAFVGAKDQFTDKPEEIRNTVINPLPGHKGALVTLEILRMLDEQSRFEALEEVGE